MTVFAHYADFSLSVALITQLLGRIDGEKQGFGLGLVRTIFLVVKLDQPIAVVLNDKIPGLSHRNLLLQPVSAEASLREFRDEINAGNRCSLHFDRRASAFGCQIRGRATGTTAS